MSYPLVRRWLIEHSELEPTLLEGAGFEMLVAERLRAVGAGSEAAYVSALEADLDEVESLTAGVAVPETWFFRYPHSYSLLVEFAERLRLSGHATLRMASIGCATGEEPYSMAMAARHAGWAPGAMQIHAFDRSRAALRRARAGEYGPASIRTEIPAWAVEFLRQSGPAVVVDRAVRELVNFEHADVLRAGLFMGDSFDVVFCRNLLIYLGEDARRRLLDSIAGALVAGGLLFVGHAEPLLCSGQTLRTVQASHTFCLERGTGALASAPIPLAPVRRTAHMAGQASVPKPGVPRMPVAIARTPVEMEEGPTIDEARELADAGRGSESEAMVRAIVLKHGPSAEALELLGMIRMAANDAAEAKSCFERSLYLDPSRTACVLQLAMICESAGDHRRAETLWNRARRTSETAKQERRR